MASYKYEHLDELGEEHALGCSCCRIQNGHDLPVPKKLTISEIDFHARGFSHSIFADWTRLNAIIKRFEPTIQRRWMKKSVKQKREILLKAWPHMPATHRPDFVNFRHLEHRNAPRTSTCLRVAYLWPYINLEDLQKHRILLLYLNSRARNMPDMFVQADIEAAHVGYGWKVPLGDDLLEGKVMQFQGLHSPRTYGRTLPFSKAAKMYTIEPFPPNYGLLALEIQQGIYSFLLACAQHILHDISPAQFFLAPHQPEPVMPSLSTEDWPSLAAQMAESPYAVPQKMDLERLEILVGARREAAEDHLWMLREDPGYFVDSLKDWLEHYEGMLFHHCCKCMQSALELMLWDTFTNFMSWDALYRKLVATASIEAQTQRAKWGGMRLALKDEENWSTVQVLVDSLIHHYLMQISRGFPASPRMRHCYTWKVSELKGKSVWSTARTHCQAESRVNMMFCALTSKEGRQLHGTHALVHEIQYMLDNDSKASQLVDSWITSHFSDLALLVELESRINGLESWSSVWKNAGIPDSAAVIKAVDKSKDIEEGVLTAISETFDEMTLLKDPFDGRFDYPAGKTYTESNVQQMREAEVHLDLFWWRLEIGVKKASNLSIKSVVARRLLEPRELYRTPRWVKPASLPPQKIPILAEVSGNVPFLSTHSTAIPETETPTKSKIKVKTRGIATPPPDPPQSGETFQLAETDKAVPAPIKVPKRAYRVLSALLPEPKAENHQRTEISWDEMIQGLNSIGLQPEKLYGSVWIFKPKAKDECLVDFKRSIQFHEPKEVRRGGKIPQNMVRVFGRRLKHTYGFEGGQFVCQ